MKPNEESNSFINNYIKASSSNNNLNLIFNINQKKIQHCKKNGQICYGFITNATSLKKLYTSILTLILILFVLCGQFYITQSLPLVSECKKDFVPVFLLQHNSTNGKLSRIVSTTNFLDCSELCSKVNDCVAVDYVDGKCHIIESSDNKYISSQVSNVSQSSRLVTKSCVKSERVCESPFHFDVYEQKILVGFARQVVPADSVQVCLSACLNAFDTFGFECESVMYYPVDAECILNTEDRLDLPHLFIDEKKDTVIYFDNNCAGSQCYAPYVTQYVAVENKQLIEELDHSFTDLDQSSCEELCTQRLTTTVNDFNCKSFMYNNKTRMCILSDERSKPLGRGNLKDTENFTYYEKKCFASERTCRNVPSFTRVPQMLLIGFAAFVMENVESVTKCLDLCTNPVPETGTKFVCKSVVYYHNEQECILNAESRQTKPEFFIQEKKEFVVDYFDINCHLEQEKCPAGTNLYSIKTINAALLEGDNSSYVIETTGNSVKECTTKCYSYAPEKCRSFNFDKTSNICNLLYLDGKTSLRPQIKHDIDFYDLHCLKSSLSNCLNENGTLFSRYLYTKFPGLPIKKLPVVTLSKCLDSCLENKRCEGVNYNHRNGKCELFAKVDIKSGNAIGEKHEYIDFYINLCLVKEVDLGFSSAVNVPKEQFTIDKSKSITKVENHNSRIESLAINKNKTIIREQEARRKPINAKSKSNIDSVISNLKIENTGTLNASPIHVSASSVHTICNYEGIKVQIKNSEKMTGVVFVKNKYDTCRVEVDDSDTATLVLGLPINFGSKPIFLDGNAKLNNIINDKVEDINKNITAGASIIKNELQRRRRESSRDCGIVDLDNGTYKSTIVVQTNNLGIPGLVTSMDQIYEISCNYSSMLGGKVIAAANMTVHGPQPLLIQPRGKIELGNPVLMQMNVPGNDSNHPAVQAKLGDVLELRWEIMAMDEELDFFVKDCFAEPGTNINKLTPLEKLQLIEDGCPTPAVAQKLIPKPIQMQSSAVKIAYLQAFRFDSSSTIRVTCHLEICKSNCKPILCNMPNGQKESWGRKKRDTTNENLNLTKIETKRYKVPRFAQATTSLVIIDPLQKLNDIQAQAFNFAKQSAQELVSTNPKYEFIKDQLSQTKSTNISEMCLNKWTLFSILGILFILIIVQALIVTKYIFKRIFFSCIELRLSKDLCQTDSKSFKISKKIKNLL